ncbi:hypothetical protein FNF28_05478 [Cafeteria roenbergensis]|uniref:Protein krueppel n=1 Tax=Cafeteria roenbergensis TaxID=33653 RepID=A0A5A8D637_CAFRO|nr:hypothetical protein FNF28_05478 [Cafeteria roenbergensis]
MDGRGADPSGGSRLFVKWVHQSAQRELEALFSAHGQLAAPLSFIQRIEACFVQFCDPTAAARARDAENGRLVEGKRIKVEIAIEDRETARRAKRPAAPPAPTDGVVCRVFLPDPALYDFADTVVTRLEAGGVVACTELAAGSSFEDVLARARATHTRFVVTVDAVGAPAGKVMVTSLVPVVPGYTLGTFRKAPSAADPAPALSSDRMSQFATARHSAARQGDPSGEGKRPQSNSNVDLPPLDVDSTPPRFVPGQTSAPSRVQNGAIEPALPYGPTCETAGLASASGKSDDAEYRFRCQSCGRGFKRKAHLSRHVVSVHDRRRDFSCEHCPRTFSTNSDRLSHTRAVHLNARPHECRLCRKSFNRKAHLRAHVARVHKNDPALAGSMDF